MYERRVLDKEILPSRVTWLCKNSKTSGFLGTWSSRKRKQSIGGRKMVGMEWKVELFKLCASAWASTKSRTIPVPIESVSKYFEAYCNVDRIPCKSLDCAYQFPLMYLLKFPSVMSHRRFWGWNANSCHVFISRGIRRSRRRYFKPGADIATTTASLDLEHSTKFQQQPSSIGNRKQPLISILTLYIIVTISQILCAGKSNIRCQTLSETFLRNPALKSRETNARKR